MMMVHIRHHTKKKCNEEILPSKRQTRNGDKIEEQLTNLPNIFQYDSEIYSIPILKNGIYLDFPSNIFV